MTRQTKDLHVMLNAGDYSDLKEWAAKECRSINAQVCYVLRQALASRDIDNPSSISQAERIKNATRAGLKNHQ